MSTPTGNVKQDEQAYQKRLIANRLRQEVFREPKPGESLGNLADLIKAEQELREAEDYDPQGSDVIMDSGKKTNLLGPQTTGLDVQVYLRMSQVPTSVYHLINQDEHPLVSCQVRNADKDNIRRLRIISYIEGYSAQAVTTVELDKLARYELNHLPTLFPEKVNDITELTRATLNVMVEDIGGTIELHSTRPVWLLARTTAVTAIRDPNKRILQDLSPYLGAFVTPNVPAVMKFIGEAREFHPIKQFAGYQHGEEDVLSQVQALFRALKEKAGITYVNSVISFNPGDGSEVHQRVRLPRESLADKQANCLDGVVLFASLLEGISLNPALVIVPGHAFVAWEVASGSNKWKYLETTRIGTHSFEDACEEAELIVKDLKPKQGEAVGTPRLRQWSLRDLRTGAWSRKEPRTVGNRITPME